MYNKNLYPFQSHWVKIEGHNIHYIDEGQGQVLLFSHAALGSSFMYRNFIKVLNSAYRCIALDYPGFGLSEDKAGEQYSIVTQSEVLRQFIEKLQLDDIIGLGHDTGGPSLFKVAADMPERFAALILTDTLIFPTKEYRRIHTMLSMAGSRLFQFVNAHTNFLTRLTFSKGVPTRTLTKEELEQYRTLFNTPQKRRRITELLYSLRQNPDFMHAIKSAFEQQLNTIPTLLIYGEKDPVTQLGVPQRIRSILQNAELYLIGGEGHFPHEGQPQQMSGIIHYWITNLNITSYKQRA